LPTRHEDPEFRTSYLQMALAESERIRDLVKDIMRATTIPSAGTEVHPLEDLIARAHDAIKAAVAARKLAYRINVVDHGTLVRTHGEAATCLLTSLLQNAVRFSPDGGEIALDLRVDEKKERAVVTVSDQGPGVPLGDRAKIFEPFFTTATDGLGMGLFVAARIADLQNVELSIESCAPDGAVFRVAFPIAQREGEQVSKGPIDEASAPQPAGGSA